MLGSTRREFVVARATEEIYSVKLAGLTQWGWLRRSPEGALVAASEQLFMDYVSCFCDARRRTDST